MMSFLADPSHSVKVFARGVFSIVDYINSQRCGCTKVDALRLNKYRGYTIKKNRSEILE